MILKELLETEDIEQIEKFLQQNAKQISKQELSSALNEASFFGDIEIVKLLIKYDADVNFRQENTMTPLDCAIENMQLIIVNSLLENGADIDSCGYYGVTPLHRAIDIEIEESNTTEEYPPSAKLTSILLFYKPNINQKDFNEKTPLDWAMERQHVNAVELLERYGTQ